MMVLNAELSTNRIGAYVPPELGCCRMKSRFGGGGSVGTRKSFTGGAGWIRGVNEA